MSRFYGKITEFRLVRCVSFGLNGVVFAQLAELVRFVSDISPASSSNDARIDAAAGRSPEARTGPNQEKQRCLDAGRA